MAWIHIIITMGINVSSKSSMGKALAAGWTIKEKEGSTDRHNERNENLHARISMHYSVYMKHQLEPTRCYAFLTLQYLPVLLPSLYRGSFGTNNSSTRTTRAKGDGFLPFRRLYAWYQGVKKYERNEHHWMHILRRSISIISIETGWNKAMRYVSPTVGFPVPR